MKTFKVYGLNVAAETEGEAIASLRADSIQNLEFKCPRSDSFVNVPIEGFDVYIDGDQVQLGFDSCPGCTKYHFSVPFASEQIQRTED